MAEAVLVHAGVDGCLYSSCWGAVEFLFPILDFLWM